MSALLPGLYRATVRGIPDVIVAVGDDSYGRTMESFHDYYAHDTDHITDARPLIVLDMDTAEREYIGDLRYVADRLPEHNVHRALVHEIADQIEAQCKPARIPEPGLWGVVEATWSVYGPCTWIKDQYGWHSHGGQTVEWRNLINPTLIREGIS